MEDLPTLKGRRRGVRSWITRLGEKLLALCGDKETDVKEINIALDRFREKVETLRNIQDDIEVFLSPECLETDIDEAAKFEDKSVNFVLVTVEKFKDAKRKLDDLESHSNGSQALVAARLPKIDLPSFSGDIEQWTGFFEQFQAVVDDSDLPDITKFTYLRSLVKGEAKAAIAGLALTAASYNIAIKILKERFGQPERIRFAHVQALLNLDVTNHPSVEQLWALYNKLQIHIRSLETLKITGNQYGVVLTPLVLSRLPEDIRMEWARGGAGKEADLDFLITFLFEEIKRRERSQVFTNTTEASPGTVTALHTKREAVNCGFCDRRNHVFEDCPMFKKIPIAKRKDKLYEKRACYRCLTTSPGHDFRECRAVCRNCQGEHHALICMPKTDTKHASKTPSTATRKSQMQSHVNTTAEPHTDVLLQTLQISVRGKKGEAKVNVLFDTGSDRTYISQDLVKRVGAEWVDRRQLSYAAFGTEAVSQVKERDVHAVELSRGGSESNVKLQATAIPTICAPLSQPRVPSSVLAKLGGESFVSVPSGGKIKIDLLIGMDHYWSIMTKDIKFLSSKLAAHGSMFGWVLSGCIPGQGGGQGLLSHQLFVREMSDGSDELKCDSFWDLEAIGIVDQPEVDKHPILKHFEETVRYNGQRYEVSLPWKDGMREKLLLNRIGAERRLENLKHRLAKDERLEEQYHSFFSGDAAGGYDRGGFKRNK